MRVPSRPELPNFAHTVLHGSGKLGNITERLVSQIFPSVEDIFAESVKHSVRNIMLRIRGQNPAPLFPSTDAAAHNSPLHLPKIEANSAPISYSPDSNTDQRKYNEWSDHCPHKLKEGSGIGKVRK